MEYQKSEPTQHTSRVTVRQAHRPESTRGTHHTAVRRLLVRAPNWIGDAVMCEPALSGLRSLFPQAELTLLAKSSIAELFFAYPGLDRVLVYDDKGVHAGLSGKWTLAGTLRRHGFDLAVLFQNAFEAAFLTWLAGIPRRYGYWQESERHRQHGSDDDLERPFHPVPRSLVM